MPVKRLRIILRKGASGLASTAQKIQHLFFNKNPVLCADEKQLPYAASDPVSSTGLYKLLLDCRNPSRARHACLASSFRRKVEADNIPDVFLESPCGYVSREM